MRKFGSATVDGKDIQLSGTGAWKSLIVNDSKTGEVLVEKKFYKADFGEVWNDREYKHYIDNLLEASMVRRMTGREGMDIDVESYEEVRSIAMDLDEDFLELKV